MVSQPKRATRAQVEERVALVEALMRRAQWERGRSNRAMAKQWDCSIASVDDYAAEAARRVRAEVTDPSEVQTTVCAALSTIVRESLRDGDRKSAVRAADVWSRVAGGRAADKVEMSVDVDESDNVDLLEALLSAAKSRRTA